MKSAIEQQQGVILLPVILTISVVALVAFLVSRENINMLKVNANEFERDEVEYLLETAYDHTLWNLAQNISCTGYSNLGSRDLAGHTYSAIVSPSSSSPVTVAVTATLSNGNSLSRSIETRVYGAPAQTTLQSSATNDGYIEDYDPGNVTSDADELMIKDFSGEKIRALIRFNISSLRNQKLTIKQARLQLLLKSNAGSPTTVSIHRVTSYWESFNLSWKNRTNDDWLQSGADFDVDPLGSAVVGTTAENWISWDVTSALRASLAGRLPNAGLILLPPSGTDNIKFYSSNVDAGSDRPKLVVDYACECGQTCAGL